MWVYIYRCRFLYKLTSFYETKKTRIEILSRMPAESRRDLSFEAPSWKKRCHQIYAYKTFNLCIFMRFDAVRIFMYFMRFELNLWIGPVRFAFPSAMHIVGKFIKLIIFDIFLDFALYGSWEALDSIKMMP